MHISKIIVTGALSLGILVAGSTAAFATTTTGPSGGSGWSNQQDRPSDPCGTRPPLTGIFTTDKVTCIPCKPPVIKDPCPPVVKDPCKPKTDPIWTSRDWTRPCLPVIKVPCKPVTVPCRPVVKDVSWWNFNFKGGKGDSRGHHGHHGHHNTHQHGHHYGRH